MAEKNPQTTDSPPSPENAGDGTFFGGGESPPPPQEQLVEVEIGAKRVKLDKSAAEAFSAFRDQYKQDLEARDREIRSLRVPRETEKPNKEEDFYTPDLDQRFFEKPSQYLRQVEERAYTRAKNDLTNEYQKATAEQQFWSDFYGENSALDRGKDHWVTKAVLAERQAELAPLPVPEAKKRLAQYTTERLLDIHKRYAPKGQPEPGTMDLEGSAPPSRRPAPRQQEETPVRISDWIREQKNRRREQAARSTRKEAS